MTMNLNCPSCSSEATQRLAVVYENGISDVNTRSSSTGIGIGRGGLGFGVGSTKTKGIAQTALSKKAAPPAKKAILKPLVMIFILYVLALMFFGHGPVSKGLCVLLWIGGSVAWVAHAFIFNTKAWPPLKAQWDQSFMCNRCNHTFHAG